MNFGSLDKTRIAFVITGLGVGGAETMLLKLISRIDKTIFSPFVVSLTAHMPLAPQFEDIEVPVYNIGMPQGIPDPRGVFRLYSLFKKTQPDLVNTWMYHADLIGGIAAKLSGSAPVIWNIRHSSLDPQTDKKTTLITAKACARLSGVLPNAIICCAESAKKIHTRAGYKEEKFTVVPNGFDLSSFRPDIEARRQIRAELNIPDHSLVVGLVGRFHPQKDHRNFINSTSLFLKSYPEVHFVMCGDNVAVDNDELVKWVRETGKPERYHLLGRRTDMPKVTAAFDIACSSSSHGEAFSNTLGEAMSCAVPCVSTDVGDAAEIIGDTGYIVSPKDPEAFANALCRMAEQGPPELRALGARAQSRVNSEYSLSKIVHRYEALFSSVAECSISERKDRRQCQRS